MFIRHGAKGDPFDQLHVRRNVGIHVMPCQLTASTAPAVIIQQGLQRRRQGLQQADRTVWIPGRKILPRTQVLQVWQLLQARLQSSRLPAIEPVGSSF